MGKCGLVEVATQSAAQSLDARAFGKARIAVIGPGTAAALAEHGITADVVAKEYRGEGLAKAMLDAMPASKESGPRRVLVARAKQAREALPEALRAGGCEVDVVPVYETRPASPALLARIRALLETKDQRPVDAITFTSASTVHGFCDAVGEDVAALVKRSGAVVASIGPITTDAARSRGIEVTTTATTYTLEGVMAALESAFVRASR